MARRGSNPDQALNLIPILNMVSLLIPFLLMAAQFVALGVIESTLPSLGRSESESAAPDTARPLLLSIRITPTGFLVGGAAADAANGQSIPCRGGGCADVEAYDYDGLRRALVRVKAEHPTERTIILAPDGRVPYEVVVRVMDTSREDPSALGADGKAAELFPVVVIAGSAG